MLVLSFLLGAALPCRGGANDAADAAYSSGDLARAARLFAEGAQKGDAYSQFRLGILYEAGAGVARDPAQGDALLLKAAAQHYAPAANRLAREYLFRGEPPEKAVPLFRQAAEQGDSWGEQGLGMLLYQGRGAPRDAAQAIQWLKKSSDQGNPQAAQLLSQVYASGEGAAKDEALSRAYASSAEAHKEVFSPAPAAAKSPPRIAPTAMPPGAAPAGSRPGLARLGGRIMLWLILGFAGMALGTLVIAALAAHLKGGPASPGSGPPA